MLVRCITAIKIKFIISDYDAPYRNPVAGSRPKFRELVIALTDNSLDFPTVDKDHQNSLSLQMLVGELGKAPETGKNMYLDLQNRYLREE